MPKQSSLTLRVEEVVKLYTPFSEFKQKHPDAVLLMRYDLHYIILAQDAQRAMRIVDIKPNKIDLPDAAGIKYISFATGELETLLPKLIRSGVRVAVCEQIKEPSDTTKSIKRGVV